MLPRQSASVVPNVMPSGTPPYTGVTYLYGQALAANPKRLTMSIQNIHTGIPLYIELGTGAASLTNFNIILNPGGYLGYGGQIYNSDYWKGAVQVSGGAWSAFEM